MSFFGGKAFGGGTTGGISNTIVNPRRPVGGGVRPRGAHPSREPASMSAPTTQPYAQAPGAGISYSLGSPAPVEAPQQSPMRHHGPERQAMIDAQMAAARQQTEAWNNMPRAPVSQNIEDYRTPQGFLPEKFIPGRVANGSQGIPTVKYAAGTWGDTVQSANPPRPPAPMTQRFTNPGLGGAPKPWRNPYGNTNNVFGAKTGAGRGRIY